MTRTSRLTASIALAALPVVSLVAQDRTVETPSSAITVIGCVQHTDQPGPITFSPLGTTLTPERPGTAATLGEPPAGFLLTDAIPAAPTPAVSASAPPMPVGTSGSIDRPESYVLDGNDSEFTNHVGHRVEVTGTLLPPSTPAVSAAGSDTDGKPAFPSGTRRLRVTTLKMIATDCAHKG